MLFSTVIFFLANILIIRSIPCMSETCLLVRRPPGIHRNISRILYVRFYRHAQGSADYATDRKTMVPCVSSKCVFLFKHSAFGCLFVVVWFTVRRRQPRIPSTVWSKEAGSVCRTRIIWVFALLLASGVVVHLSSSSCKAMAVNLVVHPRSLLMLFNPGSSSSRIIMTKFCVTPRWCPFPLPKLFRSPIRTTITWCLGTIRSSQPKSRTFPPPSSKLFKPV